MLRDLPKDVQVPFQAMVDNGLLDTERLTLALLYAYADPDGYVDETPASLSEARALHRNSVRRHAVRLEELNYLVPVYKGSHKADPQRLYADGYALTLRPDGQRYGIATGRKRIGSRGWADRLLPA